jgi:hypothetical protein
MKRCASQVLNVTWIWMYRSLYFILGSVCVWLSLMCKMILDWREFSHCDYYLVCVRFKEDCTIRWDDHCEFAVQSWKFSKKKFQQGTTGWIEETYVSFSLKVDPSFRRGMNWSLINIYLTRLQFRCTNDRRSGQIRHGSGGWDHLRGHTQCNRLQEHFSTEQGV